MKMYDCRLNMLHCRRACRALFMLCHVPANVRYAACFCSTERLFALALSLALFTGEHMG